MAEEVKILSEEEIDGILAAEAEADMTETQAVFAEVDSLRTQVAELQAGRDAAYDANSALAVARNELEEANMALAEALDKVEEVSGVVVERGKKINALQTELTTKREERKVVESNLTATAEELDRERSRFHWREAIASAIATMMFVGMVYLSVRAVDLITGTDEDSPAAIEETRRDREPATAPATTTQPAAKTPIKKRFGAGSTK